MDFVKQIDILGTYNSSGLWHTRTADIKRDYTAVADRIGFWALVVVQESNQTLQRDENSVLEKGTKGHRGCFVR